MKFSVLEGLTEVDGADEADANPTANANPCTIQSRRVRLAWQVTGNPSQA
jgi:hypothetical protein